MAGGLQIRRYHKKRYIFVRTSSTTWWLLVICMKKIVFIVNPISGGKSKEKIVSLINQHIDHDRYQYKVIYTKGPADATVIARNCDADIVVAVGGDGTVSEVATGLVGTDKALGIIPCGSGDGLALHLGISRNPLKAIKALNDAVIMTADSAVLDGKPFFCTCGAGFDALVGWNFAKAHSRGLMTYVKEAVKAWFGYKPDHYVIKTDDQTWEGDALIVTVGNASQWGNNARITPLASMTDGLLDITVVKPFSVLWMPSLAVKLMTGKAYSTSKTVHLRSTRIDITRDAKEGPVHLDGDPAVMKDLLHAEVKQASLKIAVPSYVTNI